MSQADEQLIDEIADRVADKLRKSPPIVGTEFIRQTLREDLQRLSGLPSSAVQVFAFILEKGPSHLFDIKQGRRMKERTIYWALAKLKGAEMISVNRNDRYFVIAKGFVPFAK